MFTGIVEALGTVVAVTSRGDSAQIAVREPTIAVDAGHGDSIAVNGVCLTVVERQGEGFVADVMGETLRRTALGALHEGSPVNLERAAMLSSRMGGHLVQGHVDGVGEVLERQPGEHWDTVRFSLPRSLSRYVVEKGSIAVDGVSLTVVAVDETSFGVGLIPTTLTSTTLGTAGIGARVNLEVDILAKYVEKLLAAGSPA
ncbi:MAG: riboflavin synthase [Dactylosporangium sp.]|nr:riboflavin synthase [Dactylosporangium sp.]NNJ60536.1 riboflavin synthase [Dactylosporangium sp.]